MRRILVVEDEPDIALGLEEDLRRHGYDVQTVGDGENALRRARAEAWDLILLDVMLPRMDGFQVCRELREIPHPHTRHPAHGQGTRSRKSPGTGTRRR